MGKDETWRRRGRRTGSAAPSGGVRTLSLARALSKRGVTSRSDAIRRILAGDVRVDGVVVRDPGHRVTEATGIEMGDAAAAVQAPRTIALHKPRGVVTTRSDPQGRPTVYDLVRDVGQYVAPVGRLDLASSGLLLMTNDSTLADWLLDPAHAIPREYVVTMRGELSDEEVRTITTGVRDRGELLRAERVALLKRSRRETHVRVVLTEGKNRELRRLFGAVGHEVTRLMRISFGALALGALAPGRWREVTRDELRQAFRGAPVR